jgi:hypothetical protein
MHSSHAFLQGIKRTARHTLPHPAFAHLQSTTKDDLALSTENATGGSMEEAPKFSKAKKRFNPQN